MGRDNPVHQPEDTADPLEMFCQAVTDDLSMLAVLHNVEPDAGLIDALRNCNFPEGLGLQLRSKGGLQVLELMEQALKAMPKQLDKGVLDELAADYASIYLNYGIQASPEESVWIDDENLICQDTMFQVRSWYKRHGLAAPDWRKRPDDHLVLELNFISYLFADDPTEASFREAAQFMDEHLLRWLTDFGTRVSQRCATPYFAGVATLTSAYCEELRDLLAETLNEPRPSREEIEDRMNTKPEPEEVPVSFMPGMGPVV